MNVNSQSPADVQDAAKKSSEAACHSGNVKKAATGIFQSGQSIQNFNRPLFTNQESEELGIATESLGLEFDADKEVCLWPDLQLFKSTREF